VKHKKGIMRLIERQEEEKRRKYMNKRED